MPCMTAMACHMHVKHTMMLPCVTEMKRNAAYVNAEVFMFKYMDVNVNVDTCVFVVIVSVCASACACVCILLLTTVCSQLYSHFVTCYVCTCVIQGSTHCLSYHNTTVLSRTMEVKNQASYSSASGISVTSTRIVRTQRNRQSVSSRVKCPFTVKISSSVHQMQCLSHRWPWCCGAVGNFCSSLSHSFSSCDLISHPCELCAVPLVTRHDLLMW